MPATTLVHHIGQLVTPTGNGAVPGGGAERLAIHKDVEILLEGDRVGAILPAGSGARADREVDAQGGIVLPGLVDACLTFDRIRGATDSAVRRRALAALGSVAALGTTAVDLRMSHRDGSPGLEEGLALASELGHADLLNVSVSAFSAPSETPSPGHEDRVTSLVGQTIPAIRRARRVATFAVACGAAGYTRKEALVALRAARGAGLELRIESCGSVAEAVGVAGVVELTAIDRVRHVSHDEARALRDAGVIAVLEPGRPLIFDEAWPSARPLLDAGVPVALASYADLIMGGVASLWTGVAAAVKRMGMSLNEALCAVTLNGAAATHRAHVAGTVEVGKSADLVILDLDDYRDIPRFAVGMPVSHVLRAGREVAAR
ncbi:MAG: amidohydrolase family protein [Candidatus Bipolaricaulota bacterium]